MTITTMDGRAYLTTAQLARRWSMSPNTLRNWRHRGKGPAYFKPSGHMGKTLYRIEVIETWEREHNEGGGQGMSNQWCHLCGGLVDLIGLQPRDVRLCDCKSSRAALRADIERWRQDFKTTQTEMIRAQDEAAALRARVAELEAERNLLPNMPINGAMRREWERIMLRPFTSASEEAFRAMLRAALAGKQPQEGE